MIIWMLLHHPKHFFSDKWLFLRAELWLQQTELTINTINKTWNNLMNSNMCAHMALLERFRSFNMAYWNIWSQWCWSKYLYKLKKNKNFAQMSCSSHHYNLRVWMSSRPSLFLLKVVLWLLHLNIILKTSCSPLNTTHHTPK